MHAPLTFDLADRRIEVHVEDEPWRSHLSMALRAARIEPGGTPHLTFQLRGVGEVYEILLDGRVLAQVRVEYLVTSVEKAIIQSLIPLRPDVLWLHAGAACRDDGVAVLLAGRGGHGKSTLTIGLAERGWRYLSDDTVPILLSSLEALPFARTPNARIRLPQDEHRSVDDLAKHMFELPESQVQREPVALSHLVFPRFAPDHSAELSPLSKSAAAVALLDHCRGARVNPQQTIAVVGRIVRTLNAYGLSYSRPEDALDLIDRFKLRD